MSQPSVVRSPESPTASLTGSRSQVDEDERLRAENQERQRLLMMQALADATSVRAAKRRTEAGVKSSE